MQGTSSTFRRPAAIVANYPAVPAAGFFIAGIGLYARSPASVFGWLVALLLAVGLAIGLRRRPIVSTACFCLAWLIAGLLAGQLSAFQYPADHIGLYSTEDSRLAQLELSLDDPPRVVTNPFDQRRTVPPKQTALARVLRVRTWDGWREASGEVLLQIAEPHPRLAAGQVIRATGMLQRPAPAMNPGQFDWAAYYRERRVLASLSVAHAVSISVLSDNGPGPIVTMQLTARRLLADGFPAESSLDHALLRALLLGDNDPQLRDVQEQFQKTGTAHHLAISGTHVAVVGLMLWGVLRLFGVRPRWAAGVTLFVVLIYGLLALPSPPVVRSITLALAMGFALLLGRRGEPLHLLSASVIAMLVYHPMDLFNAGFQLSFGTVLGLVLLTRPTLRALETVSGWNDPDRVVKRSLRLDSPFQRMLDAVNRHILQAIATGLVAWLVSMPLIAWHFEQLNPWAILAGILLAPIVALALLGGMIKLLLTLLWPALSVWWAWLATWPVVWMRGAVDKLATWPFADVPVPPSPWWLIALFFLLLLAGTLQRLPDSFRWTLRFSRCVAVIFIVLPPLQTTIDRVAPNGSTRITLLAVGAGQCAVVQPPGGRTIMLDAGSSSLADPVAKCIGPFLRHSRSTTVDTLVLSHADFDHVSAADEIVGSYDVREVLSGERFASQIEQNPQTRKLLADLESHERPPRLVLPGQRMPIGRDTAIEILWPPMLPAEQAAKFSANDGSLVLRVVHAGRSVLFPGDIQDGAMRELLKTPEKLQADVLVAMHHGSAESLSAEFIAAVNPGVIISSNDCTLTAKQRAFDRIVAANSKRLMRTNDCGAITLVIDAAGKLTVEPFIVQKAE